MQVLAARRVSEQVQSSRVVRVRKIERNFKQMQLHGGFGLVRRGQFSDIVVVVVVVVVIVTFNVRVEREKISRKIIGQ